MFILLNETSIIYTIFEFVLQQHKWLCGKFEFSNYVRDFLPNNSFCLKASEVPESNLKIKEG